MPQPKDIGAERFRDRERRERDHQEKLPGEDDEALPTPSLPWVGTPEDPRRRAPAGGSKFLSEAFLEAPLFHIIRED